MILGSVSAQLGSIDAQLGTVPSAGFVAPSMLKAVGLTFTESQGLGMVFDVSQAIDVRVEP